MKFSSKDFFSKSDQIRRKLKIWSYLLKKPLMENLFFSAVLQASIPAKEASKLGFAPYLVIIDTSLKHMVK